MSESSSRGYTKIRDIGSGPGEPLPVGDSDSEWFHSPKISKDHKDPKGSRISRGYQGDDNNFLILNSYSLQRQLWQAAMARPFWCRREGMGMCWTLDESWWISASAGQREQALCHEDHWHEPNGHQAEKGPHAARFGLRVHQLCLNSKALQVESSWKPKFGSCVRMRSMRWGSCLPSNTLTLCWNLRDRSTDSSNLALITGTCGFRILVACARCKPGVLNPNMLRPWKIMNHNIMKSTAPRLGVQNHSNPSWPCSAGFSRSLSIRGSLLHRFILCELGRSSGNSSATEVVQRKLHRESELGYCDSSGRIEVNMLESGTPLGTFHT